MRTELFHQLYEAIIDMIETTEKLSIDNNMLDNGYYLDWHDKLNKLSLDSNRV